MYNIELPRWIFEQDSTDDSTVRLYQISYDTELKIKKILDKAGINHYMLDDVTDNILKAIQCETN